MSSYSINLAVLASPMGEIILYPLRPVDAPIFPQGVERMYSIIDSILKTLKYLGVRLPGERRKKLAPA